MSAARDNGVNITWAGNGLGSGGLASRSTMRRHVAQCRRSQTRATLCRRESG